MLCIHQQHEKERMTSHGPVHIEELNSGRRSVVRPAAKWIKKLTKFTQTRMQRYAKARTKRSTGNLSNSIRSTYKISGSSLSGEVFVPETIKYAWAAEEGIKRSFVIYGKPLMAFPAESWKQARRASSVMRIGKGGVYIFASVKRGRYKGRKYTERAFNDLLAYYVSNESEILSDVGQALVFAKS